MIGLCLLAAFTGAVTTHALCHKYALSAVRSAALVTLTISLLLQLLTPLTSSELELVCGALYGGAFVGMTQPGKLSYTAISVCSAGFTLLFFILLPELPGLGGALGLSAFLSVVAMLLTLKLGRVLNRMAKTG